MSLSSINLLHLTLSEIYPGQYFKIFTPKVTTAGSNQGHTMTLHTYTPYPMSLPSINCLHLTVSEIKQGQTFQLKFIKFRCVPEMGKSEKNIHLKQQHTELGLIKLSESELSIFFVSYICKKEKIHMLHTYSPLCFSLPHPPNTQRQFFTCILLE